MFKTIDDLTVTGKRVLVRVDLNVPMQGGRITDATRLDRVLPTIRDLSEKGARVVLLSHFGRPKGNVVADMSLAPLAKALSDALGRDVAFAPDCIGDAADRVINALAEGDVALLENLRFHAGEEANDAGFVHALADLGDIYVNDAFSCAHRAHASTEGLAKVLPAAAGRLMQAELEALSAALSKPDRPVAAVVGGAKVSTKLAVLGNLVGRVDKLIIGGGMANTFLFAQGHDIGASLCEKDMADTARDILAKAESAGCAVLLPTDVVVAREFAAGADNRACPLSEVTGDEMILDIGPETAAALETELASCKTVVWNGPMGAFEIPPFNMGTNRVAAFVGAASARGEMTSVAGGGDTVAALAGAGADDKFSYISTAGGAFLEWLEGKTLPGVAALG